MRVKQGFVFAAISAALVAAPTALAAPSDLDTSFGTNGVAQLPSGDRYAAQYDPLLQSSGKILTVGLLKNSSDRAFIERLTTAGAVDTTYGSGGEVHTNSVAPYRSAPSAVASDGRTVIAAGSNKDGRITLERFTADGQPDTTFGASGTGRFTVDIGGPYINPTSVISLSPTGTLVTALVDKDGVNFALMKFTTAGLDPTFGNNNGIARAKFAKYSLAESAAVLSNGSILVVGETGDKDPTVARADTAIARFTSAGKLDTTFNGTGLAQYDLSGNVTNDYALSVVPDNTGAFAVAGPAGTRGMVARFTSTGAKDTSFGTGGVQFVAPTGTTSTKLADVILDGSARMVVAGTATTGTTSKWIVARLNRQQGNALDTSFAPGGATQLLPCTNVSGYGASGLAMDSASRLLVAGSCGDAGAVAVARFFGVAALPTGASLGVSPGRESAGHERVPLSNIDPTTVLGAVDKFASAPLGSGPLGSGPLGSGPLGSGPLGSGPLGSGPLGSGPLGSGPLGSGPLGSGPLGSGPLGSGPIDQQILLSDLPLLNGQTWTQLLAPYYPGGNVPPLQTITLADAYAKAASVVDSLKYSDIDITRTPLRRASLAAVLLTRPLQYVMAPSGGWCTWLNSTQTKLNCNTTPKVDITKTTLLELEFAGDDLSAYYANPLLLAKPGTDLGTGSQRAMLAYLDLRQVDTKSTPFGAVPATQVASLLACDPNCSGTIASQQAANQTGWTKSGVTIGDLIGKLPLAALANVSLGQLLGGMINVGEIPYETASTTALLNAASLRSSRLQTYTAAFDIACNQASGLKLVPQLADNARLIPGSATVAVGGGSATAQPDATKGSDGQYAYDLSGACAGRSGVNHIVVTFKAEPGSELGPQEASVTVRTDYGSVSAGQTVTVDDSIDPGNGPADAVALTTDKVIHGWIADANDVDTYTFTAPAAGTRVSITLSHIPQGSDFDLHVYGPAQDVATAPLHSGPLGSGPLGSGPLGSGAVPDSTGDAIDPAIVEPDNVQDLPLGSGPLGSGPLGSGSINRGNTDEAVTFRVRQADAGKPITVQAVGYGGSSGRDPYVLRRADIVAAPAPPCPARTIVPGTAGAWPTTVPADTKTLYLVNRARLAGLNTEAQAGDVMTALNTIAGQTDGVVVPVESDANTSTSAAYSAWDGSPCDESKANAVVAQINKVVDDVKQAGNGLKQLRSIVLVGPDPVIPGARLRDDAVLSNEFEYASDAQVGANDDAVSGSLRDGYLISDDVYGDFDVSKTMYVPDVALGRLVETAPEITDQINRFVTTNGVIDPQDAVVMGYDFFSDGANAEAGAFSTTANNGQWDATAALNAINRATTGYTAVNGHYDSHRALPSAAFSGANPNLLYASQAHPNPGSMLFTMGCHSGLNISASILNPGTEDQAKLGDWAQTMAQNKALWAGSTGFSYGDTEAVAYTEKIMADAASNMASKKVTVGQALMYAKQQGVASAGVIDAYYIKSSEEATFYGLPMYRIGANGGTGDSGMPPTAPSGGGTQTSDPLPINFNGHLVAHTDTRGTYYTYDTQPPLTVQGHPLQPSYTTDVTSADGQAHGYLIDGLTTQDLAPSNPVIARPTVDLAGHEPEPIVTAPYFGASLATVTNEATATGRRDKLTVAAGQYRGDHQRNFASVSGRVMRSNGNDFTPLVIERVDGEVTGNTFAVRVEVDGSDAVGGNVLYRTDADTTSTVTWRRADLAVVSAGQGLLATGGTLPAGANKITEAIVQVYDNGYNVSLSDYKIINYSFQPIPQNDPTAGPNVVFSPNPAGGYATVSPQVSLDSGEHSTATFEYSIDGGPWTPYTAGTNFQVPEPADGEHLIAFRGSDGSYTARQLAIDRVGPTVIAEPDRVANAFGWYNAPVTVSFRCADAVSGVASCPSPVTKSGDGADQSVGGTATDRAGNSGSGGTTVSIDSVAPTISGSLQANGASDPHDGSDPSKKWYWNAPTLKWTCSDDRSGIASCPADSTPAEGADQTVTKTAKDKADNTKDATVGPFNVDLANGSVAFTTSSGSVLLPGQKVTGTATDTANTGSGIAKVKVTYTRAGTTYPVDASVTCGTTPATKNNCSWAADLPPTGIGYTVMATATEYSGRTFDAASAILITVNGTVLG